MNGCGKARRCQRSRHEVAIVDRQPDIVPVADVEIGMSGEKGLRLGSGRVDKDIDIMVAIELGRGYADQCPKRAFLHLIVSHSLRHYTHHYHYLYYTPISSPIS